MDTKNEAVNKLYTMVNETVEKSKCKQALMVNGWNVDRAYKWLNTHIGPVNGAIKRR